MKTILLSGVAAVAVLAGGQALAADMPLKAVPAVAPAFTWTGWYVGVNAGGMWGTTAPNLNINDTTGHYYTFGAGQAANIAAVMGAENGLIDNSNFTGGVQFGRNQQTGPIVYGFEVDFEYFNPKSSNTITGLLPPGGVGGGAAFTLTNSVSGSWLSTSRARLGIANNNWMIYGTVGGAAANVSFASTYADATTSPPLTSAGLVSSFSSTQTLFGVAAGAGGEYAFSPNWTLRAEYLYIHLNSLSGGTVALPTRGNTTGACPPHAGPGQFCSVFNYDTAIHEHIVRAAINFKF
jgi:outer membrane immunogenic protein